jgi:hypothetical protein
VEPPFREPPLCAECAEEEAQVHCTECEDHLCAGCDGRLHGGRAARRVPGVSGATCVRGGFFIYIYYYIC